LRTPRGTGPAQSAWSAAETLQRELERRASSFRTRKADGEEIEIQLPGGYSASAAVADALKTLPGVVAVEPV
jgi:hypothetical protein